MNADNAPAAAGGEKKSGPLARLWNFSVHPTVFVCLCMLWSLDLGIGSVLAYNRDPKFWVGMDSVPFNVWLSRMAPAELPLSVWVYILAYLTVLVALSLVLCTVGWFLQRKKRRRTMAEVLLHLGFMLVFTGFVVGSAYGERVQNVVVESGRTAEVESMGIKLKLGGVRINRDSSGQELETVSEIELQDLAGNTIEKGSARLNHPLVSGSTVVYPEGGEERTINVSLDVSGAGRVTLGPGADARLPDGRSLSIKGILETGQVADRWVGPGAFVVLMSPGGAEQAGDFIGSEGIFRAKRIGNLNVSWAGRASGQAAVFNIHRDPGIRMVLLGAVFLTLGTFWALAVYLLRGQEGAGAPA